MKLAYTDKAIGDLQRLRDFIATHHPAAAARIAAELLGKIKPIKECPK